MQKEKNERLKKFKERLGTFKKWQVVLLIIGLVAFALGITSLITTANANRKNNDVQTELISNSVFFSNVASRHTRRSANIENNYATLNAYVECSVPLSSVLGGRLLIGSSRNPEYYIEMTESTGGYYSLDLYEVDSTLVGTLACYDFNSTTYKWTLHHFGNVAPIYTKIIYDYGDTNFSITWNQLPHTYVNWTKYFMTWHESNTQSVGVVNASNVFTIFSFGSDENIYQSGYALGVQNGASQVLDNPNAYDLYTQDQYLNYGIEQHSVGVVEGSQSDEPLTIANLVFTILEAPAHLFTNLFNFEIFGINISYVVKFLVGIALIVWVFSLFRRR